MDTKRKCRTMGDFIPEIEPICRMKPTKLKRRTTNDKSTHLESVNGGGV